ncbi:hypothetical protein HOLleu_28244 [Holothuria leucospilota]|uniref:Uncharacterized protein n=1 Tax=Holothuria leucospilota TaxID=206669 RepID=A0A9Q1BLU3_HOLLE|nr:hypothetical protein HOLleu_28244 [Holothuria leucospilota]
MRRLSRAGKVRAYQRKSQDHRPPAVQDGFVAGLEDNYPHRQAFQWLVGSCEFIGVLTMPKCYGLAFQNENLILYVIALVFWCVCVWGGGDLCSRAG